jgi:NADH:ubiquinone oxidoreductase subunit 6 (subunit J)
MMLTLKEKRQTTTLQDLPIGFFIGFLLFLVVFVALHQEILTIELPELAIRRSYINSQISLNSKEMYGQINLIYPTEAETVNRMINMSHDIQSFGILLYQDYFFNILIAGVILLVALLGAVTLASEQGKQQQKRQKISQQLSRQMNNAVLRVKS